MGSSLSGGNLITSRDMPVKLGNSPLLEVLLEIRFKPATPAAGDVLLGLLYSNLKADYPAVVPLPTATIPREIKDSNPNLAYLPSHRIGGEEMSIQVGDRIVALSTTKYPGWSKFKTQAVELLDSIRETELVTSIERVSFRYINVIDAQPDEDQLSFLNIRFEIVGRRPPQKGLHLRSEFDEKDFITVIQIAPNAAAKTPSGRATSGLLIDLDTIRSTPPPDFFVSPENLLEQGHNAVKRVFYSLLTEDTLQRLAPGY